MKRIFDILLALIALSLLFVPALIVALLVKVTSKGPMLYWSDRVGRYNKTFSMPKFRTMQIDTPTVATHLLDGKSYLTSIGGFLRKTSLDEIPQLWSILVGDMSFVGPRPALYNQDDLIKLRTEKGVERCVPGLTGWAQINGRDEISIPEKVELDNYYAKHQCFFFDLNIIVLTFVKVIGAKDISH